MSLEPLLQSNLPIHEGSTLPVLSYVVVRISTYEFWADTFRPEHHQVDFTICQCVTDFSLKNSTRAYWLLQMNYFFPTRNAGTWRNGWTNLLSFLVQSLSTMRNKTSCFEGKLTTDNKEKSVIQGPDEVVIDLLVYLLIGSEPFHGFYCPFYAGASHWFTSYIV